MFHSVEVEEIKDQKLACEREMAVDPRDQEYDLLQIWNLKYEEVRPTLKIFLFPLSLPCFSGMGRSVGKLFFFIFLKF